MNEYTYIYILIYVCVRGCGERYKYIEVQSVGGEELELIIIRNPQK